MLDTLQYGRSNMVTARGCYVLDVSPVGLDRLYLSGRIW